jgi:hypothetical protein
MKAKEKEFKSEPYLEAAPQHWSFKALLVIQEVATVSLNYIGTSTGCTEFVALYFLQTKKCEDPLKQQCFYQDCFCLGKHTRLNFSKSNLRTENSNI